MRKYHPLADSSNRPVEFHLVNIDNRPLPLVAH